MKRISWKAVVIGGLTDWISTAVLGIAVTMYVGVTLVGQVPRQELAKSLRAVLEDDVAIRTLLIVVGALCSVLGGYVAATIAKHDERLNGTLASIVCVGIGIYFIASGRSSFHPMIVRVGLLLLTPALAWLGGFLRSVQVRKRAQAAAERTGNVFS